MAGQKQGMALTGAFKGEKGAGNWEGKGVYDT
jgi:hypothetical protein